MSTSCNSNCESCGENCPSRTKAQVDFKAHLAEGCRVDRVFAVMSGKGGVGKSLVTSLLAVKGRARGLKTAILDADITGPSIPKTFGIDSIIGMTEEKLMIPSVSSTGIEIMSTNLLLENETDPVIWRGPVIGGVVKQFWEETYWDDIDCMFVDMPPGTGDVPLTVFQSLPVNGIIIVTSPQELVGMIVEKAVNMARMMKIPVAGIVENMSWFECPDCGKRHYIFGESHVDEIAAQYGIPVLAKLPIDPKLTKAVDEGMLEFFEGDYLEEALDTLLKVPAQK